MIRRHIDALVQDLRYALRRLGRARAFTAASVLILMAGIGACTAMFSIVRAVLLRPLAVRDPGHVTMLWEFDTRQQALGELTYRQALAAVGERGPAVAHRRGGRRECPVPRD
jgi:hypothetical protein